MSGNRTPGRASGYAPGRAPTRARPSMHTAQSAREAQMRQMQAQRQAQRLQRPQRAPRGNVRGTVVGRPQPHVPSRRTLYKSSFDTDCRERTTDVKEILKDEIGRVGEQDVAYRLHRGDTSIADLNRDPIREVGVDPLDRENQNIYKPGSIYAPANAPPTQFAPQFAPQMAAAQMSAHAPMSARESMQVAPQMAAAQAAQMSVPAAPPANPNGTLIQRPVVYQKTPTANPTKEMIGISDIYVEFDSFEKLQPSDPPNGLFVFSARSANDEQPIDNIIEMEIYPFFIPKVPTDPAYQPNFYFYRRVTIAIENITGIQFVKKLRKDNKWHFELEVQNAGSVFRLEPNTGEGKYIFTKPIRDLNLAEFRFQAPDKNVNFLNDCFDATVVNPPDFGVGGDQRFEMSIPHGLTIGSQTTVFFTGFNSTNSTLNEIINSEIGHIADVVTSTKVQLTNTPNSNLLGSAVDSDGNPATARMCVGERRTRFVIRFRRILPVLTNWISP